MSLLSVDHLRVEFHTPQGVAHAVNDVSLSVDPGTILGIVGETGSGKSVTIRSILGLLRPPGRLVGGSVVFDGIDLLRTRPQQMRTIRGRDISLIIQNPFGALNPVLSISKQFHNVLRAHGQTSRADNDALALTALTEMRIQDPERVLASYAHELSGGMAQRVVIALSLLLGARLVLADEPTTALDLTTQRAILDLIRQRIIAEQRAMILVTHDLGVVAQYCDHVAVMYAGRVVETGSVTQVLKNPRHHYTRALMNSVPRPGHSAQGIPGTVPSLIDYPPGCPFASRCTAATDVCSSVVPPTVLAESGGSYCCHHPVGEGS